MNEREITLCEVIYRTPEGSLVRREYEELLEALRRDGRDLRAAELRVKALEAELSSWRANDDGGNYVTTGIG